MQRSSLTIQRSSGAIAALLVRPPTAIIRLLIRPDYVAPPVPRRYTMYGSVRGIVSAVTDITQRRDPGQARRRSGQPVARRHAHDGRPTRSDDLCIWSLAGTPVCRDDQGVGATEKRLGTPRVGTAAATMVAVALAYFASAQLGLQFALVRDQVTPLWPPAGIAVAAIVLLGRRAIPGIAIGALAVNAPLGPTLPAILAITAGNTAGPVAVAAILRTLRFDRAFTGARDAAVLVSAASAGMLLSASTGTAALAVAGALDAGDGRTTWWTWWAGDATGIMIVAPAVLLLSRVNGAFSVQWLRLTEAVALLAAIAGVTTLVFRSDLPVLFAPFPLLVWAAWRFEQAGAAAASLVATSTAAITIASPATSGASIIERLISLQLFGACAALTTLILAPLAAERRRARVSLEAAGVRLEARVRERTGELLRVLSDLEESEARLAEAQQVARIGSWQWDVATNAVEWSDELYRITGLPLGSPLSYETYLGTVHPEERAMMAETIMRAAEDHQPYHVEHRTVRPDGTVTWVYCGGRVVTSRDGRTARMLGICQDIEDRKRAEASALSAHDAESRRRQALELNDEVVQGLSIAVYSLDAGDIEGARGAMDATLRAARAIVGGLLAGDEPGDLSPGSLTRDTPANLSRRAG